MLDFFLQFVDSFPVLTNFTEAAVYNKNTAREKDPGKLKSTIGGIMQTNETGLRWLENDGSLTVYLEGDIDHHSARAIRSRIDTKLFLTRPDELVLDLSRVNFMDSAGLGLILGRFTKASELGVGFRLSSPSRHIQKILDLAGMERLVPITAARSG